MKAEIEGAAGTPAFPADGQGLPQTPCLFLSVFVRDRPCFFLLRVLRGARRNFCKKMSRACLQDSVCQRANLKLAPNFCKKNRPIDLTNPYLCGIIHIEGDNTEFRQDRQYLRVCSVVLLHPFLEILSALLPPKTNSMLEVGQGMVYTACKEKRNRHIPSFVRVRYNQQ